MINKGIITVFICYILLPIFLLIDYIKHYFIKKDPTTLTVSGFGFPGFFYFYSKLNLKYLSVYKNINCYSSGALLVLCKYANLTLDDVFNIANKSEIKNSNIENKIRLFTSYVLETYTDSIDKSKINVIVSKIDNYKIKPIKYNLGDKSNADIINIVYNSCRVPYFTSDVPVGSESELDGIFSYWLLPPTDTLPRRFFYKNPFTPLTQDEAFYYSQLQQ